MDRGRCLVLLVIAATIVIAVFYGVMSYTLYGAERLIPQVGRLLVTSMVGSLLLLAPWWARWVGAFWYLVFGVLPIGGSIHFLAQHKNLLEGLALATMAIIYCGSALVLLLVPAVRAWFRRSRSIA